jgi:hypothetical protein
LHNSRLFCLWAVNRPSSPRKILFSQIQYLYSEQSESIFCKLYRSIAAAPFFGCRAAILLLSVVVGEPAELWLVRFRFGSGTPFGGLLGNSRDFLNKINGTYNPPARFSPDIPVYYQRGHK